MNINDLDPKDYKIITPTKRLNINDLSPDDYTVVGAKDEPSQLETGYLHGIKGASGGFVDEAAGAAEAIGSYFGRRGLGEGGIGRSATLAEKEEDLMDAYRRGRDTRRQRELASAEAHPGTAIIADIGGSILGPGKIVRGVKGLVGAGGVEGLLRSEAELTGEDREYGQAAQDIGIGATTGILGAGAGKLIGKGFHRIKEAADKPIDIGTTRLKTLADDLNINLANFTKKERQALSRSRGEVEAQQRILKKFKKEGITPSPEVSKSLREDTIKAGRLHEETAQLIRDIAKPSVFSSKATMANRVADALRENNKTLSNKRDMIDNTYSKLEENFPHGRHVGNAIRVKAVEFSSNPATEEAAKLMFKHASRFDKTFGKIPGGRLSMGDIAAHRAEYRKLTTDQPGNVMSLPREAKTAIEDVLRNEEYKILKAIKQDASIENGDKFDNLGINPDEYRKLLKKSDQLYPI